MFHLMAFYMGSLILRSIVIALTAGLLALMFRNVAIRHAICVAVLGSILLMPAVDFLLPPSWVPARVRHVVANRPVAINVVSSRVATNVEGNVPLATSDLSAPSNSVDWWRVAASTYALVALMMLLRLAMGYRSLMKLRGTARPISGSDWEEIVALQRMHWRRPILLESDAVQVPMTLGIRRPSVILPADWRNWDDWKLRAVLFHEIAHVRRCDWAVTAISALSKCVYWANPLSWFLDRKLSQLAEQACDDAALNGIPGAAGYAEILLEFAIAAQNGGRLMKGGIAMANHKIQSRIERVLGNPKSGTGIIKFAGWILVMLAAVAVIYSASALQVKANPAEPPAPTYVAEIGRNLAPEEAVTIVQAMRPIVPASIAVVQQPQNSTNPAATELQDLFRLETESLSIQRQIEDVQRKLDEAQKIQALISAGQLPQPRDPASINGSMSFLQDALEKLEEKRTAIQQQLPVAPPAGPGVDNRDDLLAYLKQLASLRIEKAEPKSRNRIYVTGKVQKPGPFDSDAPLTVLQALALAGGFQDYAKPEAITIIRMDGNTSTLIHFNYSEVIRGVNSSQNIYLSDGDVVAVP